MHDELPVGLGVLHLPDKGRDVCCRNIGTWGSEAVPRVWVSYQDPADLASRYSVPEELMQPLSHVGELVQAALAS